MTLSGTDGIPGRMVEEATLHKLVLIERTCSGLSIAGCAFIILTFATSRAFHKPINRLVFYASVGNMLTNVATMMSRATLGNLSGPLCQMQGFLIQMFMPADALWTFAMACNVYLTFYHKFDSEQLARVEKWYFLGCYGLPFVPAFTYIFIGLNNRPRMYGDAMLWCWISADYDILRIGTFYAPVWVAIFFTFCIYARAGHDIFRRRKALQDFSSSNPQGPQPNLSTIVSSHENSDFAATKSTQVTITHSAAVDSDFASTTRTGMPLRAYDRAQFGVSAFISSDPSAPPPVETMMPAPQRAQRANANNTAALAYVKVALLFFSAMLITWIPSSANRVFTVVNPGRVSVPLLYISAFVLPLQGVWNAVIYVVTSWKATRRWVREDFPGLFCRRGRGRGEPNVGLEELGDMGKAVKLESRGRGLGDTESVEELKGAESR